MVPHRVLPGTKAKTNSLGYRSTSHREPVFYRFHCLVDGIIKPLWPFSAWIRPIHRVVIAIREHIAAEEALSGGGEAVCVDEAADLGVVITALQVIESQLLGMGVAKSTK